MSYNTPTVGVSYTTHKEIGEVSVSRDRDSRGVTNAERDRDRDRGALKTHTVARHRCRREL